MGLNEKMLSDTSAMMETAVRICKGYLNGPWKKITSNDITIKRISGGLSNWLYAVNLNSDESCNGRFPNKVLLRIYGQTHGEGALESIITESVIFTLLSERKLGPKLFGVFPGGRIEEYIPARPLKRHEMSKLNINLMVADKMAAIHTMNVPITKEPSWLWNTMNRWLSSIKDFNRENVGDELNLIEDMPYRSLKSEVHWLRRHLTKVSSPVVFCHNDLQGGNILLTEEDSSSPPSIVIIDFEYCSYNYRGFDLANHFIEWGYDYSNPDYPHYSVDKSNLPTLQHLESFVERYLKSRKSNSDNCEGDDVSSVINEIKHFSLASHLFWALWSFVNAKVSRIPFGFQEYANERLNCYYELKGELTSGKKEPK